MRSHVVPRDRESFNNARYSASESLQPIPHQKNRKKWGQGARNALVFTDLAFSHGIVVLVELVNRAFSLRDRLLAAGLGPLVACFDLFLLALTPLPVGCGSQSLPCELARA
jgi:hypothetical protein